MLKTVGNPATRYGDQTIVDGNLVIGTAGKGIDFSADNSLAGMTSELLNDYEEGTWSGTVTAGAGTITSHTFAGTYTKIGRSVHLEGSIFITNNGTGSSQINVTVPFTIAGAIGGVGNEDNVAGYDLTVIKASTTSIGIRKYDWTYPGQNSARLNFQVSYVV